MRPLTVPDTEPITAAEAPQPEGTEERRRVTTGRDGNEGVVLVGAAAASVSLTALLATYVVPGVGPVGFVVLAWLLFLGAHTVLTALEHDGVTVRDRLASVVVHSLAVLALAALAFVVVFTFWRGAPALVHLNLFTQDMRQAGPLDPLSVGGIAHAAAGTLIEIAIALIVVVPLGLTCAVYLSEARGAFVRFVRTVVEAMTALPSIVAGLFVYASVILGLGLAKSGLAASLAIGVMMLPIVIRAADVVIRMVPGSLREAALAVGAPRWRTVWHVVLPSARSGLTTAVLLGTARGIGETAPVLITAGFGSSMNLDPTEGPMVSLPLATFVFSGSPSQTMVTRGFGAAAALLAIVLVLFALARVFGGRPAGQLTTRQQRRRARASARDLTRFGPGENG